MDIKREDDKYVITTRHVIIRSEGLFPLLALFGVVLFIVVMILSAIF